MANCDSNKNINKTFIIEPLELTAGTPTISACTSVYTSKVLACSGDTFIELYSGVTINGDTLVNNSLSANTIDASIILSGGTNILDIVNANDTFVTGGTLVNKELVLDRNDSLSAVTVDLSGLTNNTGAGLTYNPTTGKIDLGGVLNHNDPSNAANNVYFTPAPTGANVICWGLDSSYNPSGNYIGRFDTFTFSGKHEIHGAFQHSGVHIGLYMSNTPSVSFRQYKDVTKILPSSSFPGPASGMTYQEFDSPTQHQREIWESEGSNTRSKANQLFNEFEWNVYNNVGGDNATSKTFFHIESERIVAGAVNSGGTKFGIFQFSPLNIQFLDGDFKGVFTVPNATYVGDAGKSYLSIVNNLNVSDDSFFNDGTSNKRGIKYKGFGETNTETGVGANYSTLVGTSLVPKKYVDDYIASPSGNTFVTGTTFTNNQLNIALNNGTSVGTTIDNLSGLTVDGNVLVNGDVNIIGSATTINSEQVLIKDNIITLNSNVTGSTTPVLNSGFEVLRGSGDTKSILWLENTDLWSIDDDLSVSGYVSGTTYYGDGSNLTGIDDTFVTGGTYSGSTIILNRNDGNSVNVTGITSDSIYTSNGTIGTGRVATLTDTLSFNSGTLVSFNQNVDINANWRANKGVLNINTNNQSFAGLGLTDTTNGYYGGFFWRPTTNYLTIGSNSAGIALEPTANNQAYVFKSNQFEFTKGGFISGKLELSTTTDGFLMPRLTTAQKNAISSPDTNLMVFDTDLNSLQRYNGSAWVNVSDDTFVTGGTYSGSTIILNRNDGNSVNVTGITSDSIYTTDGTLTGNRTVDLDSNVLTFEGGNITLKAENTTSNSYTDYIFQAVNTNATRNFFIGNGGEIEIGKGINNTSTGDKSVDCLWGAEGLTRGGSGQYAVVIGSGNNATFGGTGAIAIGKSVTVTHDRTAGIGETINLGHEKAYGFGRTLTSGANESLMFGTTINGNGRYGAAIGHWLETSATGASVIGNGNTSTGAKLVNNTANSLALGWNTTTPQHLLSSTGAILGGKVEMNTTTDGFLMPRLTTAQKNAISSPDTNLMVFDTDLNSLQRYNGSAWVNVSDDTFVTGGTYTSSASTITLDRNDGNSVSISGIVSSSFGKFGISNTNGEYTYYDTIELALAAASSGDIIEQFSNVSVSGTTTINLINGVTWQMNGYEYKNVDSGQCMMFTIPTNNTVKFTFKNGKITRDGGTYSGDANGCVDSGNYTNSEIIAEGMNFLAATGRVFHEKATLIGGNWVGQNFNASGKIINVYVNASAGSTVAGTSAEIYNSYFYSASGYHYTTSGCKSYNSTFESDGNYAAYMGNGNNESHNCTYISSASYGLKILGDTATTYSRAFNCVGISSVGYGIHMDAFAKAFNCSSFSKAGNGAWAARDSEMHNCTIESKAGQGVLASNDVTIKNCSITSKYDNSGGHALQIYNGYFGTGFIAVGNHLKVTNASANGLKVASTNIGKYAMNTFEGSTTAIDDASTAGNQMINTPDIYGNLLL